MLVAIAWTVAIALPVLIVSVILWDRRRFRLEHRSWAEKHAAIAAPKKES